jgi:hypothetical protein
MADEKTTDERASYIDRDAAARAFAEGGTVMHEGTLYRSLDELPDDEASIAAEEARLAARKDRAAKAKDQRPAPASSGTKK